MSNRPDPNQIWRVMDDAKISFTLDNMISRNKSIGIKNIGELYEKESVLRNVIGVNAYNTNHLPSGFVQPVVSFPSSGFAPDYFSIGLFDFCSERLREALAQPPDVIDYSPIDFRCTGAKAIAQNYQRMRVIAVQPGMDLQRSCYDRDAQGDNPPPDRVFGGIDKLVLQEGFQPKTEIFYLAEPTLYLFAVDRLAARVLEAGCTGLEFQHLDTPRFTSGRTVTIRTKRGITQRC